MVAVVVGVLATMAGVVLGAWYNSRLNAEKQKSERIDKLTSAIFEAIENGQSTPTLDSRVAVTFPTLVHQWRSYWAEIDSTAHPAYVKSDMLTRLVRAVEDAASQGSRGALATRIGSTAFTVLLILAIVEGLRIGSILDPVSPNSHPLRKPLTEFALVVPIGHWELTSAVWIKDELLPLLSQNGRGSADVNGNGVDI